jgi:hypothetical protein
LYQLDDDDIDDEWASGEFYRFLLDQVGRRDPIGDVADMVYADDEWPREGGIKEVWEYLLRRGFCFAGFDAMRAAWRKYYDGVASIDDATHRELAASAFRIEDELLKASNLLGAISHPEASTLRKIRAEIREFRHRMSEEADRSRLGDVYLHRDAGPETDE